MTNKINNQKSAKERTALLKLLHLCNQCGIKPTSKHKEDSGYYINCDSCRKKVAERIKLHRNKPKISRDDDLYKMLDKETENQLTKAYLAGLKCSNDWRKNHPERIKEIHKNYYDSHKEKYKEAHEKWKRKNPEKWKEYQKVYYEKKKVLKNLINEKSEN